jgi:trk system potassium uptake protein TrkA
MKKQFVVFGMGRFGYGLAVELTAMGHEVLAVDNDAERIQDVVDMVTHAVQMDATDEHAMASLGLRNFDVAVVAISSSIQTSVLISMLCLDQGIDTVVAKASGPLHEKVLQRIGVQRVVIPEQDMALRLAHTLAARNIVDVIELAADFNMMELVPDDSWRGKTLGQIDVRRKYHVNVVAIRNGEGKMNIAPTAEDIISEGDVLFCIGADEDLARLEKE